MAPKTEKPRLDRIDPERLAALISNHAIAVLAGYCAIIGVPCDPLVHPGRLVDLVVRLTTFAKTGFDPGAAELGWSPYAQLQEFLKFVVGAGMAGESDEIAAFVEIAKAGKLDTLPPGEWSDLLVVMAAWMARVLLRELPGGSDNFVLRPHQLAALASVSVDHVRLLLRQGKLVGRREEGEWRISRNDARRWLTARKVDGI